MIGVSISVVPPDSEDARTLIAELDADLRARYPQLPVHGLSPRDVEDPDTLFLVARTSGQPVACGAMRRLAPAAAEVKRMYVRPAFRRMGLARRILSALEEAAARRSLRIVRLETGILQPEAMALYRSAGYVEIDRFGEYADDTTSRCFEKRLGPADGAG